MSSKPQNTQQFVSLTKNDPKALLVGITCGFIAILVLLILGADFLPKDIQRLDRDVAVPIGIITVALMAMRGFEKKPRQELGFWTWSTILAIVAVVADSGVPPNSIQSLANAILICIPGFGYLLALKILDTFDG